VVTTRSVFAVLGVTASEVLEVVGPDSPSDIGEYADALERAEQIGRELVDRVRLTSDSQAG
jgi:hypothetical protein